MTSHSLFRPAVKAVRRWSKIGLYLLAGTAGPGWMAVQATPIFHGISAANITVTQHSTSTSSTSAVSLTNSLTINNFQVGTGSKRGLYYVQIGSSFATNVQNGILMASIDQNGRNNNEGAGSAFPGTTYGSCAVAGNTGSTNNPPGSTGQWTIPMYGNAEPTTATNITSVTNNGVVTFTTNYTRPDTSYAYTVYNFNVAAAYFPYASGWMGGWLVNSLNVNNDVNVDISQDTFIGNTNMVLGTNVIPLGTGAVTVNLLQFGLDSRSNAVMICAGGKAEENFASGKPNPDGTWTVTCRDDQSGGSEDDPVAFVAIPLTNNLVIAGRFSANLNPANNTCPLGLHNAPFTATHIGTGTYHLVIPGVTPGHGVLIISDSEDGPNNPDNLVSYQATNDGWIVQTRDTGDDQTPNLQNFTQGDTIVDFVYIPGPTPGISVTPTNGLATSQSGGTASFSVTLDAQPQAEVDLSMAVSDPTAGTISTNVLVFEPANYNLPQTIMVTGLNNSATSPESYTVQFQPAASTDTNYAGMQAPSVSLVNIPSGQPGIFLVPATGLTTTGAGGTATFQAIMNIAPTANVTVNFFSGNIVQGNVSPSSVTFTPANWSTPQMLTVTGADDGVVDGNISYTINADPAVSSDPNYSGYQAGSVSVLNLENDVAGLIVSCGSLISVQEGFTSTFTVALSAPPVSNVTVNYASSDTTLGTVSPASLTFTPANWNVPQTVTLTGVANLANNGNTTYLVAATITTTNFGYSTLVVPAIAATTTKAIGLPSGTVIYGLGMAPVGLDGQATASDAINFSGATLSFSITANADPTDVLGVRNDPAGAGVTVAGDEISYATNLVATVSGGTGGTPLVVTFDSGVTGDTAAQVIRAVTFSSATTNDFADRTVLISLNNGGSTATKSIRVGQLRLTQYQNGMDWGYGVYNSQVNDEIAETNSSSFPAGTSTPGGLLVQVDANLANQHQVLLGFYNFVGTNAGQIPPGSTIVSADVSVNIVNPGDGWSFNRMLTPWDTNTSWASLPPYYYGVYLDVPANDPNALLEYDSQMGNYILVTNATTGSVSDSETAIADGYVSVGVTPDINAWVGGETNYGWALNAAYPWGSDDLTDGTAFSPGQDPNPAVHPKLRVYWLPPGVASATFQDGTNGYTGSHDTEITETTPNNNNYSSPTIWSDGIDLGEAPDATEALLEFEDIIGTGTNQVPPGAHIEVAMLNVASLNSKDSVGNGGEFYAILKPWQDTNTTWNSWDPNGNGILNDGVMAAVNPTVTAGVFTQTATAKVPGGYHSFEVTPDVQNWANFALPNYGWGVVPWPGGSDGWGINSSKDPNPRSHPQLVVYYTPNPNFVLPPQSLVLSVSSTAVQVSFTGSAGKTYTVWRADALTDAWVSIGQATVGQDGKATFTDTAPLPTAAFYRVSNP